MLGTPAKKTAHGIGNLLFKLIKGNYLTIISVIRAI